MEERKITEKQLETSEILFNMINMPPEEYTNWKVSKITNENIEQNLKDYFKFNYDIKTIVKKQIVILCNLLNYCKADDYDSEIEILYLHDNNFDSIKILDKNFCEEKVYLISPENVFPMSSDYSKDIINFTILSMGEYDAIKMYDRGMHWFDANFNDYGTDLMDTEETFLTMMDVLKSELFTMIIDMHKVHKVEKVLNEIF